MRIGFDAKRAFFNRSGLGNYSRDIIHSLHQNYGDNSYFLYTPKLRNGLAVAKGDTIRICSPPESWGKLRQAWWRSYKLTDQAVRDEIDIFHGLSNELPNKIDKSGIKSVVTIHDLIFMRYPEWYKPIDRVIYQRKFSYAGRVADRVITVSQQTKNDLIEFFGISEDKIKVIYQGCNLAFTKKLDNIQKQEVKEKFQLPDEYLLYVGTLEKRKNLLTLVKAIHQHGIDLPLVIVGRPTSYLKEVNEFIQSKGIENIIFLKEVAVEDLPGIYQMAKVFVYPSVFEGFGIPILEALLSGVPVITSKGGCFSEVGGETSIYVDPTNPDELGSSLKGLLNDSSLQEKMRTSGLIHAGKFANDTIAEQVMDLYNELV